LQRIEARNAIRNKRPRQRTNRIQTTASKTDIPPLSHDRNHQEKAYRMIGGELLTKKPSKVLACRKGEAFRMFRKVRMEAQWY
jgi:hypothetical protein